MAAKPSGIDSLHRAQRVAKSIRVAFALLGDESGLGPMAIAALLQLMAMAALLQLDDDITEALTTIGAEPSRH